MPVMSPENSPLIDVERGKTCFFFFAKRAGGLVLLGKNLLVTKLLKIQISTRGTFNFQPHPLVTFSS